MYITEDMKDKYDVIGVKQSDGKVKVEYANIAIGHIYESTTEFTRVMNGFHAKFCIMESING